MQLGEILDGSFNIYRRHFGLFMRLSAVVVWAPTAMSIYFQLRFGGNPNAVVAAIEDHGAAALSLGLVALIVYTTAGLLLKAGTIRIISDSYLGHEPALGPALRLGAQKIIPLLLVTLSKNILFMLVLMVGGLLAALLFLLVKVIGAAGVLIGIVGVCAVIWYVVFLASRYGVTTPVVVLEDLSSSFDAFGRSWELTREGRGKLINTMVVTWLISQFLPGLVVGGIGAAIGVAAGPAIQPIFVVLGSLLGIVLAPILPCALTLLYYDFRVRREAFDIEILSELLGTR
jgi:hypothetical protein